MIVTYWNNVINDLPYKDKYATYLTSTLILSYARWFPKNDKIQFQCFLSTNDLLLKKKLRLPKAVLKKIMGESD